MIRRTNKMAYATEYRNMMLHLLDHLYRNRSRYVAASIFCAAVLTNVMSAVLTHHNARRRLPRARYYQEMYRSEVTMENHEDPFLEGLEVDVDNIKALGPHKRVVLHSMKDPTLNGTTAMVSRKKKVQCSCCNGRSGDRNCRECHGKGFVRGPPWMCDCGCGCYMIAHLQPEVERGRNTVGFLIAPANLKPRERRSRSAGEDYTWYDHEEMQEFCADNGIEGLANSDFKMLEKSNLEDYDHAEGEQGWDTLMAKMHEMQTNLETTQFGEVGKANWADKLTDAEIELLPEDI